MQHRPNITSTQKPSSGSGAVWDGEDWWSGSGSFSHYLTDVVHSGDYYPFGMEMPGRGLPETGYRYGFQGQEKDNEVAGTGNSYTAKFWQYDSRLGRRWNIDPVVKHHESPYACFANNPIWFTDPNGADTIIDSNGNKQLAGHGYHTYENSGEHYLIGFGLQTKIWDPTIENGTDQKGSYVDFNHEDRGFDFTGFLQFEGRVSLVGTASYAIGIAFSPTDGTATVYKTWSLGAGPTVGLHWGLTGGIMIDVAADEMSGHGLNIGAHAVIPVIPGVESINFSAEINSSYSADYEFLGLGASAGIPVAPLLSNGLS
ncbi:MAG: hypothetical protein JXR36_07030, partial [Bacteroidales bacterium]|nr:hypothetical protein [Bacteroidales bacterium]